MVGQGSRTCLWSVTTCYAEISSLHTSSDFIILYPDLGLPLVCIVFACPLLFGFWKRVLFLLSNLIRTWSMCLNDEINNPMFKLSIKLSINWMFFSRGISHFYEETQRLLYIMLYLLAYYFLLNSVSFFSLAIVASIIGTAVLVAYLW